MKHDYRFKYYSPVSVSKASVSPCREAAANSCRRRELGALLYNMFSLNHKKWGRPPKKSGLSTFTNCLVMVLKQDEGWMLDFYSTLQTVNSMQAGAILLSFFKIIIFFSLNQNPAQYPVLNKYVFELVKAFLRILIACHPRIDKKLQNLSGSVLLNQIWSEFFVLLLFVCLFRCDLIRV